jgi:pterin-4a-carbinolamine dehydratase
MRSEAVWREEDESLILVHGWNKVRLTLTTHSEGTLTDNDRAMAGRIDAILGTSP